MFSVIYRGYRPTSTVGFVSAEISEKSETAPDSHDLGYFVIADLEPYQIEQGDEQAKVVLMDFLNLSSASNHRENIRDFISKHGFPVHAHKHGGQTGSIHANVPNSEASYEAIVTAIKALRTIYNASAIIDKNNLAKEILDKINRSLDNLNVAVELTMTDDGALVPRIVAGSLLFFCVLSALTAVHENMPLVTCHNCGNFYQKGRSARKDAVYCSGRCRMSAYRKRKKAAK